MNERRRTENDIGNTSIDELLGADLTGEGARGLHVAVLCRDLDVLAQALENRDQVDRRGSNDHLCIVTTISPRGSLL